MRDCIAVIGLGYVGLPLAEKISEKFDLIGYDIDSTKIETIKANNSFLNRGLIKSIITNNSDYLSYANIFIIAVPTPIKVDKTPDLSALIKATKMVSKHVSEGDIIIFESTVFPGTTEKVCLPILSKGSGISEEKIGLGYSPERINPGDTKHTLEKTTKLISGNNSQTIEYMKYLYNFITDNHIYVCESIEEAEASKLLENVQRDVNIAFMNEFSFLMKTKGINFNNVLKAASTKWNFKNFHPGLVGGHCIGIDPYYLLDGAKKSNVKMSVTLSARETNELTVKKLINSILIWEKKSCNKICRILSLGCTFKPDIDDIRNSKPLEIIDSLNCKKNQLAVFDPLVKEKLTNISLFKDYSKLKKILLEANVIMLLSPHRDIVSWLKASFSIEEWKTISAKKLIVDPYNVILEIFGKPNSNNYISL